MSRAMARLVHGAVALVGVGGLVLAWVLYAASPGAPPEDPELALTWTGRHPWASGLMALHVVAAPLLVFALGAAWVAHAWPRLRSRRPAGRATGLALALLAVPLVASGPLIQVLEQETSRVVSRGAHTALGVGWCALYAAHLALAARSRRAQNSVR